jgi:hypothetical protein
MVKERVDESSGRLTAAAELRLNAAIAAANIKNPITRDRARK